VSSYQTRCEFAYSRIIEYIRSTNQKKGKASGTARPRTGARCKRSITDLKVGSCLARDPSYIMVCWYCITSYDDPNKLESNPQ